MKSRVRDWIRRHDGAPLKVNPTPVKEPAMTNPGSKVVKTLQSLKGEIDSMSDGLIANAAAQHQRTKDGFHTIQKVVVDPWAQANSELEDYVNQLTNGGPPLAD